MTKTDWTRMPELKAEQFTKGTYKRGECRCLMGWYYHTYPEDYAYPRLTAFCVAVVVATKTVRPTNDRHVPTINDEVLSSNEERALVWNKARSLLIDGTIKEEEIDGKIKEEEIDA